MDASIALSQTSPHLLVNRPHELEGLVDSTRSAAAAHTRQTPVPTPFSEHHHDISAAVDADLDGTLASKSPDASSSHATKQGEVIDGHVQRTPSPTSTGEGVKEAPKFDSVYSPHGNIPIFHQVIRQLTAEMAYVKDYRTNDSQPAGRNPTDDEGWGNVVKRLKDHDTAMINGYTSDLDVLFIFAGLFSAVLTAFLVQSYTQLAPDNTMLTVQLLQDISQQLQNISTQQTAAASTAGLQTNFKASTPVVATNALWFLSLVFSLASALLGIFVKQWTREYMLWTTVSEPHHAAALRQYRYDALMRWSVPEIVATLPVLLQIALILFFAGLLVLVWPLDHTVASIVATALGVLLVLAAGTTFLPAFVPSCPYRTPVTSALPWLSRTVGTLTSSWLPHIVVYLRWCLGVLEFQYWYWYLYLQEYHPLLIKRMKSPVRALSFLWRLLSYLFIRNEDYEIEESVMVDEIEESMMVDEMKQEEHSDAFLGVEAIQRSNERVIISPATNQSSTFVRWAKIAKGAFDALQTLTPVSRTQQLLKIWETKVVIAGRARRKALRPMGRVSISGDWLHKDFIQIASDPEIIWGREPKDAPYVIDMDMKGVSETAYTTQSLVWLSGRQVLPENVFDACMADLPGPPLPGIRREADDPNSWRVCSAVVLFAESTGFLGNRNILLRQQTLKQFSVSRHFGEDYTEVAYQANDTLSRAVNKHPHELHSLRKASYNLCSALENALVDYDWPLDTHWSSSPTPEFKEFLRGLSCLHVLFRHPLEDAEMRTVQWRYYLFLHQLVNSPHLVYFESEKVPLSVFAVLLLFDVGVGWDDYDYGLRFSDPWDTIMRCVTNMYEQIIPYSDSDTTENVIRRFRSFNAFWAVARFACVMMEGSSIRGKRGGNRVHLPGLVNVIECMVQAMIHELTLCELEQLGTGIYLRIRIARCRTPDLVECLIRAAATSRPLHPEFEDTLVRWADKMEIHVSEHVNGVPFHELLSKGLNAFKVEGPNRWTRAVSWSSLGTISELE